MGIKKKPYGSKEITTNGTHDVSWKKEAVVNVAGGMETQEKTVTENGTVLPDAGYDALSQVNVNVPVLDTSDATATASSIRAPFTAYVNGEKITGTGTNPSLTVRANGTYSRTQSNIIGYNPIYVDVQPNTEERTFTENGTYTPSPNVDGMHSVTVNVPQLDTSDATAEASDIKAGETAYINGEKVTGTLAAESKTITQNGTYYPEAGKYLEEVTVNVAAAPVLQTKTATENGTVLPDSGYDGLGSVVVNVPAPEVITGTVTRTTTAKNFTIPALVGKSNVIMYQTGADLTASYVDLFKCINGTVDTYYTSYVSSKFRKNRIGGSFNSATGEVNTGTADHKFGITTYTYFAW